MAGRGGALLDCPVALRVTFVQPRPKGHFRTNGELNAVGLRTPYPAKKPDATKLVRSLEDAVKGIVWRDDSQVVSLAVEKVWGEPARADVEIVELA